jgi:hypothetical protein
VLQESSDPSIINDDINKVMSSNVNLIRKASRTSKTVQYVNPQNFPQLSKRTISIDAKKKTLTPYEVYQKNNEDKKNGLIVKKNSIKHPFFKLEHSKINSEKILDEKVLPSERASIFKTTIVKNPLNLNYFKQSTISRARRSDISRTVKEFQSIDISAFDDFRKRKSEVYKFPRIQNVNI